MKGNVSGYVCNHGSRVGNENTASPRLWAMLRTQASDERSWWCILPAALIVWHACSDVMGCRRPTGGVFTYVSSDRVTLRAFPVATPRGCSVSFPTRGTMVTYVTWDDHDSCIFIMFTYLSNYFLHFQQDLCNSSLLSKEGEDLIKLFKQTQKSIVDIK